jgi:hypothetical protein
MCRWGQLAKGLTALSALVPYPHSHIDKNPKLLWLKACQVTQ